jgi:hypothetical protein
LMQFGPLKCHWQELLMSMMDGWQYGMLSEQYLRMYGDLFQQRWLCLHLYVQWCSELDICDKIPVIDWKIRGLLSIAYQQIQPNGYWWRNLRRSEH